MILLIDNYDSFTYNLFHYLGELGAQVEVVRNDQLSTAEALGLKPAGIVLSPGPCTPNEAGICLEVIEKADGTMPLEFFHDLLDEHFSDDEVHRQLDTAIQWGRYAELFDYDSVTGRLSRTNP